MLRARIGSAAGASAGAMVPARPVPVPAAAYVGDGHHYHVAEARGDLMLAAGAQISLAGLERVDEADLHPGRVLPTGRHHGPDATVRPMDAEGDTEVAGTEAGGTEAGGTEAGGMAVGGTAVGGTAVGGTAAGCTVLVDREDGVVTVTLNRPAVLNAGTPRMWRELTEVFTEVAGRPDDRVVVLTGAGDGFCSGADLASLADSSVPSLTAMRVVSAAATAIARCPAPTIAKVNGVAAGAGANLALCCDLVVAADTARFCEIFARRGLSVDFGGSWLLPRLVGIHKAKELVLLADMVSAGEALAIGLVNKVVPADELDAAVDDWAHRLAAGPPLAMSLSKSLLNDSFATSFEQAVEAEGVAQAHNLATHDVREALTAWRERRSPRFSGR
jgi:enoyl-CoA hydratase/carnithine racemase